jgi:predicted transcriptional regulator
MQNRPVASLAECVKDQKLTVAELQVTCLEATAQMAMEDTERLPVVSDDNALELLGIVTRSDVVKVLRTYLENESVRERVLNLNRRGGLSK